MTIIIVIFISEFLHSIMHRLLTTAFHSFHIFYPFYNTTVHVCASVCVLTLIKQHKEDFLIRLAIRLQQDCYMCCFTHLQEFNFASIKLIIQQVGKVPTKKGHFCAHFGSDWYLPPLHFPYLSMGRPRDQCKLCFPAYAETHYKESWCVLMITSGVYTHQSAWL